MKLGVTLDILNQKDTPAFYADTLANRPAAGFTGRVFISTDTLDLYRDTGTTWVLLSPSSTGTITGSGAAGQVTYFSAASSITGSNDLFFDSVNGHLGIGTITPSTALTIFHDQNQIIQINQTTATNDTKIAFQNSGTPLWRIGNSYNAGANDYAIYDVVGALQPLTIKKTTGQTFIGSQTTSSGLLVVNSSTADNQIVAIGANSPSIRVRNAGTAPTQQFGLGLSTATNNFIQGSASGDFCIFNGSTTASPMLFGIYSTGLGNVQEAARISAARNFIVGGTTDAGQRLQITGTSYFNGNVGLSATIPTNKLTINNVAGGFTTIASISESSTSNSVTNLLLQNSSATETSGTGVNLDFAGAVNWLGRINTQFVGGTGSGNTNMLFYTASLGNLTERMRIDSGGNLGLGVNISSWSGLRGLQNGRANLVGYDANFEGAWLTNNAFFNGSSWIYQTSSQTSMYQQLSGVHSWHIAGAGTANNPITFAQSMTLAATGNLLIGTTTDAGYKLQVNGAGYISGSLTIGGTTTNNHQLSINVQGGADREILQAGIIGVSNGFRILWDNATLTTRVSITNIPTSAVGLPSGTIYSNAGILTIVP